MNRANCPYCGTELNERGRYCPECRRDITELHDIKAFIRKFWFPILALVGMVALFPLQWGVLPGASEQVQYSLLSLNGNFANFTEVLNAAGARLTIHFTGIPAQNVDFVRYTALAFFVLGIAGFACLVLALVFRKNKKCSLFGIIGSAVLLCVYGGFIICVTAVNAQMSAATDAYIKAVMSSTSAPLISLAASAVLLLVYVNRRLQISDGIIDVIIYIFMFILILVVLYPFLNALAISFNNADDTRRGGLGLWPRIPTLASYQRIMSNPQIGTAYLVTIGRTLIGTVAALFCTSIIAFGLAHKNLVNRRVYSMLCLIPMYFGGGLMPYYFLIRTMGLMDNFLVFIIPQLIGLFNIILMRTFFQEIPEALEESARIDGANYLTVFFRIIIPISTPIIATVALFVGVGHWNSWFDGAVFVTKDSLKPMQNILLRVINEAAYAERMAAMTAGSGGVSSAAASGATGAIARTMRNANERSVTMATMFITILPIVMVYPFLQRFFVKGIMVGSIKG